MTTLATPMIATATTTTTSTTSATAASASTSASATPKIFEDFKQAFYESYSKQDGVTADDLAVAQQTADAATELAVQVFEPVFQKLESNIAQLRKDLEHLKATPHVGGGAVPMPLMMKPGAVAAVAPAAPKKGGSTGYSMFTKEWYALPANKGKGLQAKEVSAAWKSLTEADQNAWKAKALESK
jgi:hypothetical protein